MKKSESGTTTYYVISSVLGSAMEVTAAGVQRAYVMSGSSVVAQLNPNGQFYWLHQDHLGSGRKMTEASGNMTYRAEFDPYGKLLYEWSAPANQNSRKFTGYERDAATNLDYAQARMYSSDWGRFMTPDPMGLGAAGNRSPKTLNRYSYVGGNPTNFLDPKGTCFYYWHEVYEGYWDWESMFCSDDPEIYQPELPPALPEPVEPPYVEYGNAENDLNEFLRTHPNCNNLVGDKVRTALKNTTFVEAKYLYNKTLVSEGIPKSAVSGYGNNPTFLDYMPPYATTNINVAITNIAAKRVYLSEQFFNEKLTNIGGTKGKTVFHELLHIVANKYGHQAVLNLFGFSQTDDNGGPADDPSAS